MTILMPDLVAAIRDTAQGHFDWCNLPEHDYETPEHEAQLCKSSSTVRFPEQLLHRGDEVIEFTVELAGSPHDVAHGVPVPLASVGFNGHIPGYDMEPWKLIPLAMALLSAEARSRGDVTMERAYLDAANEAIDARMIEAEHADSERSAYVVAERQVRVLNRTEGPYSHVQGGDPDDGLIPWEIYEAAQAVSPDVPAFIVQPGTEAGTRRVVAVSTGKPVNDTVYTDADGNAPFDLRDQLNALPRKQVAR